MVFEEGEEFVGKGGEAGIGDLIVHPGRGIFEDDEIGLVAVGTDLPHELVIGEILHFVLDVRRGDAEFGTEFLDGEWLTVGGEEDVLGGFPLGAGHGFAVRAGEKLTGEDKIFGSEASFTEFTHGMDTFFQ